MALKVIVLGAGVVGVTTAYYLAARGHEVEVIERQKEAALETSFANGGQLSFSHSEPWANPFVRSKILKWLFKEDSPLYFRFSLDPWMYIWGLKFLLNCTHAKARYNASNILRLGLYSKRCMDALRREVKLDFDNSPSGILHIFSNPDEMRLAEIQAKYQKQFTCPYELKDANQCLEMESALGSGSRVIVGGIHMPYDESGDVKLFTQGLAKYCQENLNVQFHYDTEITEIEDRAGRVSWVKAGNKTFSGDKYIMALGAYSALFARRMGIYIPVYPMKGYSLTFQLAEGSIAPKISITDNMHKVVYSRLGDRLRVAGTAEFAGYNLDIPESRIKPILNSCIELFPKCGDINQATRWTGLRPSTPSGVPIIGATRYDNLYLNTGHGTLGWTLACGSASALADIIESKEPEIFMEGLNLEI